MKKVFHANGNEKKGWVTILVSVKIDFQTQMQKKTKKD